MKPLVIDTDPGIDDALALLLAWGSPGARVEAITTVAGNVGLETATLNARRLVDLRRPSPAPLIAPGAPGPAGRPLVTATRYHGADGLGDLGDWPEPPPASSAYGPDVIVEAARRHGGALTLVALGPLTNVAIALGAGRAALGGAGRIVAMGGAVDVPGNVTPTAEFNMHVDPAAAARVLESGLAVDLVPLDATRQATLTRDELERALAGRRGPIAERILRFTARAFQRDEGRGMSLHDPLAVGVALDPSFVEWEPVRLAVGPEGETRRAPGAPTCRIATRVDRERFVATFLERICPASSS